MNRIIPACAIAAVFAVSMSAQDATIKSKTKVDADDAKVVSMTGCLQSGTGEVFSLTNAKVVAGEDLEAKSKTKIDVDDDETKVKTKSETEIEREDEDKPVGTAGNVASYELVPNQGVDLAPHVGHQVEITAVAIDKKKGGDDDAEVDIETKTKVEREDEEDEKMKTETKTEFRRGKSARLAVVSVRHIAPSCSQ
jgi:cytoskeletal protein RodZ